VNLRGIWQEISGANSRIVGKEFQYIYFIPLWAHKFLSGAQAQQLNVAQAASFELSRAQKITNAHALTLTHTHTCPVGHLLTRNLLVAGAAAYTTYNNHKRRTSVVSKDSNPGS
jgi:hypothetical protein